MALSHRVRAASSLVPLLVLLAPPAKATYSIVAADQATQQVGSAVTSCVAPSSVTIVYGAAPGFGGINAQAAANTKGRDRGVALLGMDVAPADIIQQITATSFDPSFNTRQYGVVDLQGRAAGFTGTDNNSVRQYREDRQGTVGTYTYSVQGNVLTGVGVINQAETAFKNSGCDLADRLMLALEAGAENGEGDSRCTTAYGVPADASSIEVDRTGEPAGSYLKLSFTSTSQNHQNAVVRLRALFNTWRMTHPCAGPTDGGVDAEAGTTVDAARDAVADGDAAVADADAANAVDVASDRSLDAAPDTAMPDGSAGSGGTAGMGGASGNGGVAGASGRGGVGGSAAGAGGTSGVGGVGGGGTGGSGGTITGGAAGISGNGGTSGSTGKGGAGTGGASTGTSGTGNGGSDDGGCSCKVQRSDSLGTPLFGLVALLAAAVARSRYRRRTS
jgi:MYXO-CTERM domain-containing protein